MPSWKKPADGSSGPGGIPITVAPAAHRTTCPVAGQLRTMCGIRFRPLPTSSGAGQQCRLCEGLPAPDMPRPTRPVRATTTVATAIGVHHLVARRWPPSTMSCSPGFRADLSRVPCTSASDFHSPQSTTVAGRPMVRRAPRSCSGRRFQSRCNGRAIENPADLMTEENKREVATEASGRSSVQQRQGVQLGETWSASSSVISLSSSAKAPQRSPDRSLQWRSSGAESVEQGLHGGGIITGGHRDEICSGRSEHWVNCRARRAW